MSVKITCDRSGNFIRAAVWQGKDMVDLYVDRIDQPDFTGAVVAARVARTKQGGKIAWCDAGLTQNLYVETTRVLKTGDKLVLKIKSTLGEGKAWAASIQNEDAPNAIGLITPPPLPWQRALAGLPKNVAATLSFSSRQDFDLCQKVLPEGATAKVVLSDKEPVHPDLDDRIDALLEPLVSLSGSGSIIIEPTKAFVAIDVNGGEVGDAPSVNLLAVREAMRQIRLRNLSGIILIDCLKMKQRADQSKLINAAKRASEGDPSGVQVFGLTKLGLLEATRGRHGPSLADVMGDE